MLAYIQALPPPRRLRRLAIHAPAGFADTATAHPRNHKFRAAWHRLALRAFFSVPDLAELSVHVDGCPPVVWNDAGDASQARPGGDKSVWGPVLYYDTRPVTIVDQGPPSRIAGVWRSAERAA